MEIVGPSLAHQKTKLERIGLVDHPVGEAANMCVSLHFRDDRIKFADLDFGKHASLEDGADDRFIDERVRVGHLAAKIELRNTACEPISVTLPWNVLPGTASIVMSAS